MPDVREAGKEGYVVSFSVRKIIAVSFVNPGEKNLWTAVFVAWHNR
jgi:hypothetical protein